MEEKEKVTFTYTDEFGNVTSNTRRSWDYGGFNLYDFGYYFAEFLRGCGFNKEQLGKILNLEAIDENYEAN